MSEPMVELEKTGDLRRTFEQRIGQIRQLPNAADRIKMIGMLNQWIELFDRPFEILTKEGKQMPRYENFQPAYLKPPIRVEYPKSTEIGIRYNACWICFIIGFLACLLVMGLIWHFR